MSNLLRFGLSFCVKNISNPCRLLPKCFETATVQSPAFSRSLWHMAPGPLMGNLTKQAAVSVCSRHNHTDLSHSKGEKDLVLFLQSEIEQERKSLKIQTLPADLDGFAISTDRAELFFTKKSAGETVTVSMNVNHSVDSGEVGDEGEFSDEMKARPAFDVEVEKNGKTLCFSCSFTSFDETSDKDVDDNFQITEVTYFEGDYQDKTYSVAADLLDENLYDLFMIILNEKGVTKKFVEKLSEIATSHEHSLYIHLLENVRKFASAS